MGLLIAARDSSATNPGTVMNGIDPQSGAVRILIWFVISIALCAVFVRFAAKAGRVRMKVSNVSADDWLVIAALLFSIVQTAMVDRAVAFGLAKAPTTLSSDVFQKLQEFLYAASMLEVFCLCLSKIAAVMLIYFITPKRIHRRLSLGVGSVIILWTFVSLWVVAFQCHPPRTWDSWEGKCFDRRAWWIFYEIFNIITDIGLVVLPLWIIFETQAVLSRKMFIALPFLMRLSVIAPASVKVAFWSNSSRPQVGYPELWKIAMCNAIIQCLEIILVCFIFLKQFLDSLDAGYTGLEGLPTSAGPSADGYGGPAFTRKSTVRTTNDPDSYIRLREGSNASSMDRQKERQIPLSEAAAHRGRATENERALQADQIEMTREITVEEQPWKRGQKQDGQ